jgi:hypothetical protein
MKIPSPLALLLLALAPACSRTPDEPAAKPRPATTASPASSSSASSAGSPGAPAASSTVGLNIRWSDPPGWVRRPGSNPMRKFEYTIPRAKGDTEDAELVVTTFGPGQGGSVEENIERWAHQFTPDHQSQAIRDKGPLPPARRHRRDPLDPLVLQADRPRQDRQRGALVVPFPDRLDPLAPPPREVGACVGRVLRADCPLS